MRIRIDKFLCNGLGCTRKEAKKLIKDGNVTIDEVTVKKPEDKLDPSQCQVKVNGSCVEYQEYVYIMLNKPKGVISATTDHKDQTVVDLVKHMTSKEIFPVGRLDKDTEGLLLLTNDGALAHQLLSPKKHVEKLYEALVRWTITKEDQQTFLDGIDIGEKKKTKPAILEIIETGEISRVRVTITEGRYHQVKRMFQAIGSEVLELKRLSMGSLTLDDSLKLGEARFLTKDEVERLKAVSNVIE